mgnify:CR=1 FL=1
MAKLVGFIGGPCTGKTTLAHAVLESLNIKGLKAEWANEFVTDDIQENGPPHLDYYIYEQYRFLFHQNRREESAKQNADIVLTDAPLILGYLYTLQNTSKHTHGRQNQFFEELKKLFVEDKNRYQHLYLLKREFDFEDNGIRFHSHKESIAFDNFIRTTLEQNNVAFKELSGDVPTRTKAVLEDIL